MRFETLEDVLSFRRCALELEALIQLIRQQLEHLLAMGRLIPPDMLILADNFKSPGRLADLIVANLGVAVEEAQRLLELRDPMQRLREVGELLTKSWK